MENKIYNIRSKTPLFTYIFKKVSGYLILLTLIVLLLIKYYFPQLQTQLSHKCFTILFIIELFIYSFSRDKIEDERVVFIKYKALAGSLLFSIIYTFIIPFFQYLFASEPMELKGQELIICMLIMFNIFFFLLKRGERNEDIN